MSAIKTVDMFVPQNHRRRVVITGMDALSCLGMTLPDITDSLFHGRSGITVNEERAALGFRSPLTGRLPDFHPADFFSRKQRKNMDETALYAAIASKRAVEMSGCEDLLKSARAGLLIGADSSAGSIPLVVDTVRETKATTSIGSGSVIQGLNSSPTINIGPLYGMQGISLTLSGACASGSHALGMAWMFIASGMQDTILAGGSQELNWYSMAAFDALRVFSMNTEEPHRSSRPFDKNRDGLVPSGGAAMMVVEEYEQAKARGANILAEIVGYAFSSDGAHLTTADGHGAERCIRSVLETSQLQASDIEYINAHATSTLAGDEAEARGIYAVFGDNGPPVSSTKSLTGHECWMAGASEAIYTILMMQNNFIAANANYEEVDPALAPINIAGKRIDKVPLKYTLSNSFGFGGTNACLILGQPD